MRPAVVDMAQRLADAGYVVLLPDLFYRYGPYGPFVPREVFAGDFRAILGPLMATTGNDKAADDTQAFLAYLDKRDDVAHRLVPRLEAEVYIASAENDGSYPPAMAERLEDALAEASVRFSTEIYHAAHGWMMPDFPVYDHAEAERGWAAMLALLDRTMHPD